MILPFATMGPDTVLMLISGLQVRKLMNSRYQKRIWVQIMIDRNAVWAAPKWSAVVAEFAAA